jgi:hypothetical protein
MLKNKKKFEHDINTHREHIKNADEATHSAKLELNADTNKQVYRPFSLSLPPSHCHALTQRFLGAQAS